MAGRSELQKSPAFAALCVGGKQVLKVVEDEVRRGGSAISIDGFMERADLCRSSVRRGIRQCEVLAL